MTSSINLDNRVFKPMLLSSNGEVNDLTIFRYYQKDNVVWAEYSGGEIIKGFLIGTNLSNCLNFNYQHINKKQALKTGKCKSEIQLGHDGLLLLKEEWQWTCDDFSKGSSKLIEIR